MTNKFKVGDIVMTVNPPYQPDINISNLKFEVLGYRNKRSQWEFIPGGSIGVILEIQEVYETDRQIMMDLPGKRLVVQFSDDIFTIKDHFLDNLVLLS